MTQIDKKEYKNKEKNDVLNEDTVREALTDVYDPEVYVDIVSLGLVYEIKVSDEKDVTVIMTLTFPGCPYGPSLIEEVEERLKELPGVRNVQVRVTFDPPWSPEKIDPDVRATLNL